MATNITNQSVYLFVTFVSDSFIGIPKKGCEDNKYFESSKNYDGLKLGRRRLNFSGI